MLNQGSENTLLISVGVDICGRLATCSFPVGSWFSVGESKGSENTLPNRALLSEQVATISFAIWSTSEFRLGVFD